MAPDRQPQPDSPRPDDRTALQDALVHVLVRRGFAAVAPETVARAADLQPSAFFAHYDNLEQCYLALYDRTVGELRAAANEGIRAAAWTHSRQDWRHQLDGAVGAVLSYLVGREELASAVITHVASVGEAALARREAMLAEWVMDLEAARAKRGEAVPPVASEVLVRGIYHVVAARVAAGETRYLRLLLEDLSFFWHAPDPG